MTEKNNFYGAYAANIEYFRSTQSNVPPPSQHEWCEVYLNGEASTKLDNNCGNSSSTFSSSTSINENSKESDKTSQLSIENNGESDVKTKNDVKTILSNQIYLRDSKDSKTRFFRFHHTNFLFFLSFNKLHYVLEGGGGSHNKI